MARRRSRKTAKIPPMEYDIDVVPLNDGVIDLNQELSVLNRKFFRQGSQVAIESIRLMSDGDLKVDIYRLPDSWCVPNAWNKAYAVWQESQQQVLETDPSYKARYRDFKVYMNAAHADGSLPSIIASGTGIARSTAAGYEWAHSHIQMPNDPADGTTTEYTLHMIGDSTTTSLGIIAGYEASRARVPVNDPNLVTNQSPTGVMNPEAWMSMTLDTGDNLGEIREDLEQENDQPPYPVGDNGSVYAWMVGGSREVGCESIGGAGAGDYAFFENSIATRAGTALANQSIPGFLVNCGLIAIKVTTGETLPTFLRLRITVAPGSHKGIASRSMKDVN